MLVELPFFARSSFARVRGSSPVGFSLPAGPPGFIPMDLVATHVRLFASAIDIACAAFVAFYVFLVIDLFGVPPPVVAVSVTVVFLAVRLVSAVFLDVECRGTPGRFLLSSSVVDWRGDPVPLRVAAGRRALGDVWFFAPVGLGLWVAALRAGVAPVEFVMFDWLVVLLVWGDVVFFALAAVWHASGGWAFPHDYVFGTLMAVTDRGLLVNPDRGSMLPGPEGLNGIPGLKDRPHLQSIWDHCCPTDFQMKAA